jgi:EpsI family protein
MADFRRVSWFALSLASVAAKDVAKRRSSLMRSHARFVAAFVVLAGTALFLQARGRGEIIPQRLPLSGFPQQLGEWVGTDVAIDKGTLDVLGPGDFLLRIYRNDSRPQPYTDLFIAYFPTQRTGDTIHSPKNCLPGSGWNPIESERVPLSVSGHPPFVVNRYLIAKGRDRKLVLYWYWAHGRAVASEYWAKIYLVTDAIRMNRSDGSLVRLTTPMAPDESAEVAMQRLLPVVQEIVPLLNQYIPQ